MRLNLLDKTVLGSLEGNPATKSGSGTSIVEQIHRIDSPGRPLTMELTRHSRLNSPFCHKKIL